MISSLKKYLLSLGILLASFNLIKGAGALPEHDDILDADLIALVEAVEAEEAARVAGAPAPIHGVIVPPVPVIPPAVQARIDAHAAAFPFSAPGRPFVADIQKAWLKHWSAIVRDIPQANFPQRQYPLMRLRDHPSVVPSFGWTFVERRMEHDGIPCQMCGKEIVHDVFKLHNAAMIVPGCQTLDVGNTCALYMQITEAQLREIVRDNDGPLP